MATHAPQDLFILVNRALGKLPTQLESLWHSGPQALPYAERVVLWLCCAIICGLLLFRVRDKQPGWTRFWAALPIAVLNCMLPLLFDGEKEQNTNISIFITTTALSSFKALGWVVNRGPLTRRLNLVQFMAVYMFPITPREGYGSVSEERGQANGDSTKGDDSQAKGKKDGGATGQSKEHGGRLRESAGTPMENFRNFCLKAAASLFACFLLINFDELIPRQVKTFLYGFSLYCCLGMAMDGPAAVVGSLIGLSLAPHFDNPYHSTTLGEFWNKRWNLTVSNALRFSFYDPICEGRLVKDPKVAPAFSMKRRMAGLLTSFFMSGVLHELLIWYFSGTLPGLQLIYFTMWAPLLVIESAWRHELRRRGIKVPKWLAWLTVMAIVQASSDRLFWEPHYRLGTPGRAMAAVEEIAPWIRLKGH